MATYIVSKNRKKEQGVIGLSTAVFESIVNTCIADIPDVAVAPAGTFQKSVNCKVVDDKIVLTVDLVVASGQNITETCNSLKEKIQNDITYMTDFSNVQIYINVVGFSFA